MKKSFLHLAIMLLFSLITISVNAQTHWVKTQIDKRVSVKLPKAPTLIGDEENIAYQFAFDDSTLCVITITDLGKLGLDSATLASLVEKEEFFEQFKVSFLSQSANAEIKKSEIAKWNDYVCYNIELIETEKDLQSYFKCVFIGSDLYLFTSTIKNGRDTKNKDLFFQNIELSD
ncbi:MAG: hypothetical protein LC122_15785 [Chitinophagales bacterium]|nr:hypothetical protein [Chitinophagales bacterium]